MMNKNPIFLALCFVLAISIAHSQTTGENSLLTLDRIYSNEFKQDRERKIQWIQDGDAYITIEQSESDADELIRYESQNLKRSTFVPAIDLVANESSLNIESFTLSQDGTKVLIFTNSSRVWRSNTKGDFWVYDLKSKDLRQLGADLPSSSLMFAKFSTDNRYAYYVHAFNIYKEDFKTGNITQLTKDGTGDIINGTFDWAYEEEFGKRDGFSLSPKDKHLAFWQLDASDTGVFYMINNTDSIYSQPVPVQYPKVGQEPSAAKIGVIDLKRNTTRWIPLPGGEKENYIPGMQWVHDDLLLLQQMNRHQNKLIVWAYTPSNNNLRKVYTETEETWVDLGYPDISASGWGGQRLTTSR